MTIFRGEMNFVGNTNLSVRLRASTVAVSAGTRNHFSFYRIYGLTLSPREKMVQVAVVSRRPALLRRSSPLVSEKTSGIQGKMLANLSKESFFSSFGKRLVAFKSVIFCGKMMITFRNSAGLICRSQVAGHRLQSLFHPYRK